jgi:uncharacterized protein YdhG (YjbR/CyaY superfamily)
MAERKGGTAKSKGSSSTFSDEERAAMKDYVREKKVVWGKDRAEDEKAVLAKIGKFPPADRSMGSRLHAIVKDVAPELSPRLWYGMPAYTRDGDVVCYFQPAHKFKVRYGTLGFSDQAKLDEGRMWPVVYAITELTGPEEARVRELVRRAAG